MEELKKSISNSANLPEFVVNDFASSWEKVSYTKGEIISKPNQIDNYLHFTISGIQKAYYIIDGTLQIISFTQPNHFSCAPESFLTQAPSKYYFECITASDFYRISHKDFLSQIKKHIEIQELLINSLMGLVNNITERFIKQTSYSIEKKYTDFMKNEAHLINKIPHKDIANYLSMNPANFSKLINNIIFE